MILLLGRPEFFLTLTSRERQAPLLAACAMAHMRKSRPLMPKEEAVAAVADQVGSYVNDIEHKWDGLSALQLCQSYPAVVERELNRQLESFLGWLTGKRDTHAEACPPFAKPVLYQQDLQPEAMPGDIDADVLADAEWDKWDEHLNEDPPFWVRDLVSRIEWQKRGFPHAHMLLWVHAWCCKRDAVRAAAAAATPITPKASIAPLTNNDQIWPLSKEQLDLILSGKATAIVRPRNLPSGGRRRLSCRDNERLSVQAVVDLGRSQEIVSESEWRAQQCRRQLARQTRPHRATFLVDVLMVQRLRTPIRYTVAKAARGDHLFRPMFDGPSEKRVQLCPPPGGKPVPAPTAEDEAPMDGNIAGAMPHGHRNGQCGTERGNCI